MAEKPEAHIVHETSSRLRLRVPDKRHDKAFFAEAARLLKDVANVEVEANPVTGSILVVAADASKRVARLGPQAPFEIVERRDEAGFDLLQLRQKIQGVNERFSRIAGGGVDARSVIVLALFASSVLQIARGRTLAPAVTLLWYAGEALRLWAPGPEQKPR